LGLKPFIVPTLAARRLLNSCARSRAGSADRTDSAAGLSMQQLQMSSRLISFQSLSTPQGISKMTLFGYHVYRQPKEISLG
jgi:hypothetical protein